MHLKYLFPVVLAVFLGCDGPLIDQASDTEPAIDGSFEPLDEGFEESDGIIDAALADATLATADVQVIDPDAR